jgi:hypothetical protein
MNSQAHGDHPEDNPDSDALLPSPSDSAKTESKIPDSPSSKSESYKNSAPSTARKITWLEIALLFFNAGVVIVGIIALVIYSGQLDVMRRTLGEMQRSGVSATDQMWQAVGNLNWNARAAQEALNESRASNEKSARRSQAASDASIRAMQQDQRPWVTASRFELAYEIEGGKEITVKSFLLNSGKTPALKIVAATSVAISSTDRDFPSVLIPGKSRWVLAPGVTRQFIKTEPWTLGPIRIRGRSENSTVMDILTSPLVMESDPDRPLRLYFYMLLTYEDSLGTDHWTAVCAFHVYGSPLNEFVFCDTGNEMDQEPWKTKKPPIPAETPSARSQH